jgi:hypothetical protein
MSNEFICALAILIIVAQSLTGVGTILTVYYVAPLFRGFGELMVLQKRVIDLQEFSISLQENMGHRLDRLLGLLDDDASSSDPKDGEGKRALEPQFQHELMDIQAQMMEDSEQMRHNFNKLSSDVSDIKFEVWNMRHTAMPPSCVGPQPPSGDALGGDCAFPERGFHSPDGFPKPVPGGFPLNGQPDPFYSPPGIDHLPPGMAWAKRSHAVQTPQVESYGPPHAQYAQSPVGPTRVRQPTLEEYQASMLNNAPDMFELHRRLERQRQQEHAAARANPSNTPANTPPLPPDPPKGGIGNARPNVAAGEGALSDVTPQKSVQGDAA